MFCRHRWQHDNPKDHDCQIHDKGSLKGKHSMKRAFPRFQLTIALAAMGIGAIPALAHAYTPEQQRLCSDDAMRLCSADVPDVDRITACMQRQYSQLSKGCKSVFRGEKSEASASPKKQDR